MELEKVMKLIDAGYTKAEIEAMLKPAEVGGAPAAGEQPKPAEAGGASAGEQPKPKETNELVLEAINNLTKTIQANAFFRDGGNAGAGGSQTAEEILAGMFADPRAKDKK